MRIVRPIVIDDAILVSSNVTEDDYASYDSGVTYALGDSVIVVSANVHLIYESLQDGNLANTPADSPAWWLEVGATNRWKMFDEKVNSQTINADSIVVVLAPAERFDTVILLNISASSVHITVTDPVDGVVYDQTTELTYPSGIQDWWSYFFEPVARRTDFKATDLPPYTNAEVTVELDDSGSDVACGELVIGLSRTVGVTVLGPSVGIQDFSIKTQDEFGNYTILERTFSQRGTFDFYLDNSLIDELVRLLSTYRATPVVYIGTETYDSTLIYGFYKDFSVVIAYFNTSLCSLEIEGLT